MFRHHGSVNHDHSAPYRAPTIIPPRFYSEGNSFPRHQPSIPKQRILEHLHPALRLGGEFDVPDTIEELESDALPIMAFKETIVGAVKENPITIVVAETGAGKSTQVPQFLLDAGWDKTYLTQPRRAAARNVFERIRNEVAEKHEDPAASHLVSFQTAGERDGSENARIRVVTDGLHLVRELNNDGVEENEVLVIDEVHEWNCNIEVLVAWVKQAIAVKPNLRVVLMSATIEADRLAHYFSEVTSNVPPIIEVPGRLHQIERLEKPDSTVVAEVVNHAQNIMKESSATQANDAPDANGILVFMPGKREIGDAIDEIRRRLPPDVAKVAVILPLHAKLSPQEQQAAIARYHGVKIVVATDVAQTSLTIPDIGVVIDSGMQRRMELDQEGVQGLVPLPISQADCDQRAGRTGRVGPGVYVLTRMDEATEYVPYIRREKYPTPEILRTDIIRNTLRIAGVGLDIAALDLYHPVDGRVIERAKASLQVLGALAANGIITAAGSRMNEFPIHASSSRMMVEAGRYSEQTRTYMAAIVAAKEVGGLQYFAYNVGTRWRELIDETSSDLLAQLDLFIATQDMTEAQLKSYDLDVHNIARAHELYRKITKRLGAPPDKLVVPSVTEREDLRLCTYAGLIDSIYKHEGAGFYRHLGGSVLLRELSNRSVVAGHPQVVVGYPYRVEITKHGEEITKHIIEHATTACLSDLGRVAAHLTNWQSEGYAMRNGKFVQLRREYLGDIDLGRIDEVPAEPSPKLREVIIAFVLKNAGKQQQKLRAIKKELEDLAHLAKDPVRQLTHDAIVDLVGRAAPTDITDPTIIDNNLRILMVREDISLVSFVSADRRARIIEDAPRALDIGDVTLRISYRNKIPVVKNYRTTDIEKLETDIFLPDGRVVYFMHDHKKCTLIQLQRILAEEKALAVA